MAAIGSHTMLRVVSSPASRSVTRQSFSNRLSRISGRRIATITSAAKTKKAGQARNVVPAHSVTILWNAPFVAVPE